MTPGTVVRYRPRAFRGPVRTGIVRAVTSAGVEIDGRIPGRPWRTVRVLIPAARVTARPPGGWRA